VVRWCALASLDLVQIGLLLAVLIASLSFHEAAHAWAADRLGDPTARLLGRLSLNPLVHIDPIGTVLFPLVAIATGVPLIGWAKPVPVDVRNLAAPRRDFALVAAAGPASNLVLAAGGAAVFTMLRGDGDLGTAAYTVAFFVMMNVLLAVFNLIPVPPLDGGNILLGILPPSLGGVVERLRPYGILVLYGLMFSGLLSRITYPVQNTILRWLL
jgi:Zn-dependent protease